ncbi:MAG: M20 family metallopeptidase [Peptoniphilaceae bacterium]|nr:M20 family metallopeptidase [Peptoniphilaceae bacterium]MDD7382753.1 M20 family metallopeptidase [Peptoniphilaceae bacterium]MDY3737909.1 M20 family metallopeptidase [Peptoniphilaceae bacterium]
MNYLERSKQLYEKTIGNRRYLHENAEAGLYLPKTKAFVKSKLEEYGLNPKECGEGITATLGKGGKCILLRADMDALSMPEESGLEFACKSGETAHACGHDLHTAYLLTAAKMLKENEKELKGTVKFMFQPAEELFLGGKNMVENGILENPKVDVAMGFHIIPGKFPVNMIMYNNEGTMMFSSDNFRITVKGKGSHGAAPQHSIDPINIAVNIYSALQELIAREVDPSHACVLTIGKFNSGSALNVIPEKAVLEGTLRCNNNESRDKLFRRIHEVTERMAKVYNGKAEVEILANTPMLINDKNLNDEMISYIKDLNPDVILQNGVVASASEDFAVIANRVPSVFMYVSGGFNDDRGLYPAHNPKVQFNEESSLYAPAYFAHCATEWLKNNN